jgi:hypothetical protein
MSWHCIHETDDRKLFCPPEGCSKSFGCAREVGWQPGDPTPKGCDGIIRSAAPTAGK